MIHIENDVYQFKILSDGDATHVVEHNLYLFVTCSTNPLPLHVYYVANMLQNLTPKLNTAGDLFTSGSVGVFPNRNLYIISQPFGTYNSVSDNGDLGILKTSFL